MADIGPEDIEEREMTCVATDGRGRGSGTPAIEVEGLRKAYGDTIALGGVSFTVAEGEIVGILGPNGAGKTTAAECVTGLRRPDAGHVRVLGLDPLADGAELHEVVGVQLQTGELPARLRVREILELYRSFYRDRADAGELLEVFGLAGKRDAFYKSLSGGQKQRLSIALALIGQPTVAVLDEMTTGLDPRARRETWDFIEAVRDRGTTMMVVTHFMDEAQRLCDRVALMDHGQIVAIGTPGQLAEEAGGGKRVRFVPGKPFDDQLLTDLPEVRSLDRQGRHVVVSGSGRLVNAVILTLAAAGVTADDVELESATLEDAFIALTGSRLHEEDEGAQESETKKETTPGRTSTTSSIWPARVPPRAAFRQLLRTESLLALRQPTGLILGLGLPVLLLVIFGSIPAFGKPHKDLGGLTVFDVYLPILVALVFAGIGLFSLPIPLASYRELGILRRLSTTPLPPSWVLAVQLIVNLCLAVAAVVILVVAGVAGFGLRAPQNPVGFLIAAVLSATALFAIGLWIAAIARTGRAAGAIGAGLFYPLIFFAGLWVPQQIMPPVLRDISDYTPLGASVQAIQHSVQSTFPPAAPLLTMAGYTIVFGYLAVRTFRWE
jgi:ABC-2 type transport system ATP-binding protein